MAHDDKKETTADTILDPTKPFFMAAAVTSPVMGRPIDEKIDWNFETPTIADHEAPLIVAARENARQYGGRYYIFEVRAVRRITKLTEKMWPPGWPEKIPDEDPVVPPAVARKAPRPRAPRVPRAAASPARSAKRQ